MLYVVWDRAARGPGDITFFSSYSAMEQCVKKIAEDLIADGHRADWCVVYAYEQDMDIYKQVFKYTIDAGLCLRRSY